MIAAAAGFLEFLQDLVEGEAAGFLAWRIGQLGLQVFADEGLAWHGEERVVEDIIAITFGAIHGAFEGIGAEVLDQGHAQRHQGFGPDLEAFGPLFQEQQALIVAPKGGV